MIYQCYQVIFNLYQETEMINYTPGLRETNAGWRETGHYIRRKYKLK